MAHAEATRLEQDARREKNWKRWGPYLAERQWGTVREDYSADGDAWAYFPHDHARSRAYRWGEDGLLGITDRECRLCFALALWNGRDPILKERLFGLSGAEGNHGEDAKESWFYLDATPTHSYLKALYKYPQAEFPYAKLREENARRGADEPEVELADTGVFDDGRYFDVFAEYAKAAPDDILIRITVANRGPEAATLHLLPTLWFRNTWSWGREGEGGGAKPRLSRVADGLIQAEHATLGSFRLAAALGPYGRPPGMLFTENETNFKRLYGVSNTTPFVKDAFHRFVVNGQSGVVNSGKSGTRSAFYYRVEIPPREQFVFRLCLSAADEAQEQPFGQAFDALVERRRREADEFHAARIPAEATLEEAAVIRQATAGLLWSEQFYHYVVKDWLEGDPAQPAPPPGRAAGPGRDWLHLHARDVLSVSDKWEHPWFAAWDLAFHALPLASLDPGLAKHQLVLLLREWYMHPNGQLPAHELALGDVNPPVHAWACWRVYQTTRPAGARDRLFLERTFQKLLLHFAWWVNRRDPAGHGPSAGDFPGLDDPGTSGRPRPLPGGGTHEQADGAAWTAFFCTNMLAMALELASEDPAYEDLAAKFFEHFVAIADAMDRPGGPGLWDEQDGFYYDRMPAAGRTVPLRIRSMAGLVPLIAVVVLEQDVMERLPGFMKRVRWFLGHRKDLAGRIAWMETGSVHRNALLAIPSRERLERVLRVMLDESEFLSPFGLRSLSRAHADHPFVPDLPGAEYHVEDRPDESATRLLGGGSSWRGPVWFPLNHLLIEALERYHRFYGDDFTVECPTGSGRRMDLGGVASELADRLSTLFLRGADGRRPCDGDDPRFASDPHWRDLVLFHEYFHGDTGRGLGASHQTGWTALAAHCLLERARARAAEPARGLGVAG